VTSDLLQAIQVVGFPVIAALFAGGFGYKVVFYVLHDLHNEIRNCYDIIVKLIDSVNGIKKEICKLEQRLAELREQHRNYNNLCIGNTDRPRVHGKKH